LDYRVCRQESFRQFIWLTLDLSSSMSIKTSLLLELFTAGGTGVHGWHYITGIYIFMQINFMRLYKTGVQTKKKLFSYCAYAKN
jgi:hypothetical protein